MPSGYIDIKSSDGEGESSKLILLLGHTFLIFQGLLA